MEWWSDVVVELCGGGFVWWWSGGVLEWWSGEMVLWWSGGGVVEWLAAPRHCMWYTLENALFCLTL